MSSAAPSSIPVQERCSARKPVTWVRAKTKTRSKNSSRGVTRRSGRFSPSVAVRAEPAVLILCLSSPSCQCADRHILTLAVRFLYRPKVQVLQGIYVFSNARALANFLALRKGEVRRISLLRLSEKGYEQRSEREFGRAGRQIWVENAVLVLCKATGQAPLTLFGQSLYALR